MLRLPLLPTLLAATATLALTTACEDAPDYPVEPSIEFKSMRSERSTVNGTAVNRLFVTINYKDGDGDLGLSADDRKVAPFTTAPYDFNYYATLYTYDSNSGTFVKDLSFNGAFDRMLAADAKPQPIRGELTYEVNNGSGFPINYPQYKPGNPVKLEIFLYDRAQHKSNVLLTEEYVLP